MQLGDATVLDAGAAVAWHPVEKLYVGVRLNDTHLKLEAKGDSVEAVVLGVKAEDRRISLGLKQALGDPWVETTKRISVGSVVEGPVVTLMPFGAFVQLAPGEKVAAPAHGEAWTRGDLSIVTRSQAQQFRRRSCNAR